MDPDPDATNMIMQILVLVVLTLINAFFAGAEMALVSVNKTKISNLAEDGNKKAQQILKLLGEPTKLLSTIQVAITLSGFFASASAATGISAHLAKALEFLKIPYTSQISFVLVTVILSFFTLVYGELVPKRVALQKAETFSMFCVGTVVLVSKGASPFIRLLTFVTNITLKIFGMNAENLEERVSKEEIQSMIEQGKEQGVFNNIEHDMINSIFEFDNKLAREIMTPRINVFAIDISEPKEEYFDELFEMKYSRIPVYEEEVDNIVGVLYIKDILREAKRVGFEHIDIGKILHEPYLVPENKNIDELFREMQHEKKYFAILINEYGEFSGVVTIEDLVEEVMGDIADEYDENGPQINKIDDYTYLIDGLVSVDDINDRFDLEIDSEYYDTISGFMIDELGFIPKDGDTRRIKYKNLVFELVSVKEKRIDKIKLYFPQEEEPPADIEE
ncbi:hemolysin family protein [Konateibacter massiliensis]|uniref:hemolysin family protein n=1 Tax=Konateibacter massiliensis TaxID=2002841 RepID=UPI000C15DD1C|nr:hemolysin family protein [Konateibacter massiliensis]